MSVKKHCKVLKGHEQIYERLISTAIHTVLVSRAQDLHGVCCGEMQISNLNVRRFLLLSFSVRTTGSRAAAGRAVPRGHCSCRARGNRQSIHYTLDLQEIHRFIQLRRRPLGHLGLLLVESGYYSTFKTLLRHYDK